MGVSSIVYLVDAEFQAVDEEDFDKALDGVLTDLAMIQSPDNPYRCLLDVLSDEPEDSELESRARRFLVGKESGDEETGEELTEDDLIFTILKPQQLNPFGPYVSGDIAAQWEALFPERKPGMKGWLKFSLSGAKALMEHKCKPADVSAGWYRDDYERLLQMVRRAIDENLYLVRTTY